MSTMSAQTEHTLLAELRQQLVGFVERRVESRDAAEDIVQDVLERAHRADLSAVADLPAWLYRASRNAVIDHYRARRVEHELPAELPAEEAYDAAMDPAGPNEATQELARCMRPLVERLPERYRRAITLVEFEGRTHAEAARAEQISISGMKSRAQRGRAQLAALLQGCCEVATDARGAVSSYERRERDCC